jgi:hypothetical protein
MHFFQPGSAVITVLCCHYSAGLHHTFSTQGQRQMFLQQRIIFSRPSIGALNVPSQAIEPKEAKSIRFELKPARRWIC